MPVRSYVYLDLERILNWLAQLQGGVYDELQVEVTEKIGRQSGFDAKGQLPLVNVELGVQRGGSSEESETVRKVLRQVAPSYATRLFDELEEQDSLVRLAHPSDPKTGEVLSFDPETWKGLRRGDIIETSAAIDLDIEMWLPEDRDPSKERFESAIEEGYEVDARAALKGLKKAGDNSLCAVAWCSTAHRLIFALDRANLLVRDDAALNEVYRFLAQVERKYGSGYGTEAYTQRTGPFAPLTPVLLVTPVAIY